MKTIKDLIFVLSASIWLLSNIICSFVIGPLGGMFSNLICIILFGSLVLIKLKNKNFNNWLNKDL